MNVFDFMSQHGVYVTPCLGRWWADGESASTPFGALAKAAGGLDAPDAEDLLLLTLIEEQKLDVAPHARGWMICTPDLSLVTQARSLRGALEQARTTIVENMTSRLRHLLAERARAPAHGLRYSGTFATR